MGFKSVMKKVGKVALKVAPYALMATGIGAPAGMALAAASSIADKKLSGGSWKSALLSGGLSAGTYGVGAGALKGIGPSSKILSKVGAGALGKSAGTGVAGKVGSVLGNMGTNAAMNAVSGGGNNYNPAMYSEGSNPPSSAGRSTGAQSRDRMRGIGPQSLMQRNQNSPNLAESINAGRQNALANQPFRKGYDITYPQYDQEPNADGTPSTPIAPKTYRMPPIYPNIPSRRQRRQVGQGA